MYMEKGGQENNHFEYYHSSQDSVSKRDIPTEFTQEDSKIRCLNATIAFGMGMDVPDISYVVHWGAPDSIVTYAQELGRCGRDGSQSKAILYKPPNALRKGRVNESMRKLVLGSGEQCIRLMMLSAFQLESSQKSEILACCNGTNCCSYCDSQNAEVFPDEDLEVFPDEDLEVGASGTTTS